jgi:hypothetical protein
MGCCGKKSEATKKFIKMQEEAAKKMKEAKEREEFRPLFKDRVDYLERKKKKFGEKRFNELYGKAVEAPKKESK